MLRLQWSSVGPFSCDFLTHHNYGGLPLRTRAQPQYCGSIKCCGPQFESPVFTVANYGEESHRIYGKRYKYDVFISFRGDDTRCGLIGYLRDKLQMKGIDSFVDDDNAHLPRGENISVAISKAIKESKSSIIVLSKNYATSTWCLDELVMILECKKRNNKIHVIPVFYHVDPSDVRHQRKSYGRAIAAHKKTFHGDPERVRRWESALSEICSLSGFHMDTSRYEITFIKEIVDAVYAKTEKLRPDYTIQRMWLDNFADKDFFIKNIYFLIGYLKKSLENAMDLLQRTPQFVINLSKSYLTFEEPRKLKSISELPSTTHKVYERCYFSSTREMSNMLWSQVTKEIPGLKIVMPQTEIPEWFDFRGNGGNPRFWVQKKFPIVALALVFHDVSENASQSRQQLVELELVINGQPVPRKGDYNFQIVSDHVLVCDLRLLFSDEQWLCLDAFLLRDWNLVQLSYKSSMMLSCWGVFLYKQETDMEDVKFICPHPKYSYISPTTKRKRRKKMIDSLSLDKMFKGTLMKSMNLGEGDNIDVVVEQMHDLMETPKEAEEVLESKPLDENPIWAWVVDTTKKSKDEKDEAANNAEIKPPMDIGEASTSGHQGSSEVQSSSDAWQQEMMEIFYDGMLDGLLEAHRSFPALDIETIMSASLNKANGDEFSLLPVPKSDVENPESEGEGPSIKLKIYTEGIINGLHEAKLTFPTLDIQATLNTVLSRRAHKEPTDAPPMVQQGESEVIMPK